LVILVTAVVAAVVALSIAVLSLRPVAFDPLRLPPQNVLDRVDGVAGPAVRAGAYLHVKATKCNISGHPLGVSGHITWRSVEPPGTIIDGAMGSAVRPAEPRCVTTTFANVIPESVLSRARELSDAGHRSSWQVTSVETPLAPNGVARAWATDSFVIVPG